MAERPRVDLVSIVSRIRRGPVDKDDAMEAEVAVDVLDFLDHACKNGCEPGRTAKLTVLDLCAAIVAFGAARNVNGCAKRSLAGRANSRKRCRPAKERSTTRRRVRACRRRRRRVGIKQQDALAFASLRRERSALQPRMLS
jgi:hypothetical protein